jgi:hypothetical protein
MTFKEREIERLFVHFPVLKLNYHTLCAVRDCLVNILAPTGRLSCNETYAVSYFKIHERTM